MSSQYSVVVQWSDEDQAYLVILPEFGSDPQTHGETYDEAIKNAQVALDLLVDTYRELGRPLPAPAKFKPTIPA